MTLYYIIMKVEDNRVVEATKLELFDLFVEQEWYYIIPYNRYLEVMEDDGCKIVEGNNNKLFWRKVKLVLSFPFILVKAQIECLKEWRN